MEGEGHMERGPRAWKNAEREDIQPVPNSSSPPHWSARRVSEVILDPPTPIKLF